MKRLKVVRWGITLNPHRRRSSISSWSLRINTLVLGKFRIVGNHQNPPPSGLLSRRTGHPLGAPPHPASSPVLALGIPVQSSPGPTASHSNPSLTDSMPLTQPPRQLAPTSSAGVPCCLFSCHPAHPSSRRRPLGACAVTEDPPPTSHLPQSSPGHLPCSSLIPLLRSSRRPSVSFGGFGLRSEDSSREYWQPSVMNSYNWPP